MGELEKYKGFDDWYNQDCVFGKNPGLKNDEPILKKREKDRPIPNFKPRSEVGKNLLAHDDATININGYDHDLWLFICIEIQAQLEWAGKWHKEMERTKRNVRKLKDIKPAKPSIDDMQKKSLSL